MTDSSTGGYLTPKSAPYLKPFEDGSLEDFLSAIFAALTALDPSLVRPRWQKTMPNMPSVGTNWMAFGIMNRVADNFAVIMHEVPRLDEPGRFLDQSDTDLGEPNQLDAPPYDVVTRNEVLEILCSIYGDSAGDIASLIREGLAHPQNREVLQKNFMGLVNVGDTISAPQLVNEQWAMKLDMNVYIRRKIVRTYPVLNILSATGQLVTDVSALTRPITVNPPPTEE